MGGQPSCCAAEEPEFEQCQVEVEDARSEAAKTDASFQHDLADAATALRARLGSGAPRLPVPVAATAVSSAVATPQTSEGTVQTATSPAIALQKMRSSSHAEIDYGIMRGIPLHLLLRRSEFWTSPDEIRRRRRVSRVWSFSQSVQSFDIFLSHTWRSKGRWKVLALVLQSGWLHGFCGWLLGTSLVLVLRALDLIEDPWRNVALLVHQQQFLSPLSPYTMISGGLCMLIGLSLSPFLPCKQQMCYLDAACIHLGQGDLFERGIYSIAGCLAVAKELRVLYSQEYLSSLWCLFELVGFRKANPEGKLVFSPLFIERSAMLSALFIWFFAVSINFVLAYFEQNFRQEHIAVLYLGLFSIPQILVVHVTRRNYREKEALIFDLSNFDLERTTCASEFDRSFILSAIDSWYGDRDSFRDYVRGPLREELLALLPSPHLPCSYVALILSSMMAYTLDFCLSLHKAGAPVEILLKQLAIVGAFFVLWFWSAFNGIFYLSDRTATAAKNAALDFGKTLLVAATIFMWTLLGFAAMIASTRSTNFWLGGTYFISSLFIPCCILDVCKLGRRPSLAAAAASQPPSV